MRRFFLPYYCYSHTVLPQHIMRRFSSVQFSRQLCPTLCDPMNRSTPGLPVHHQLPEFTQTHVHRVSDAIQPSHLLSSPSPPAPIPPSIRVFSNESTLRMRWPKYWSFSFSISRSKEIPGLISFRMDWLDLLTVQGTLKSLLQHHSSKASILRCSAFFTVQLSHPYMIRLPCTLNWLRNVKTNNVITLALLNMWQHFRNLELHLATSKEYNNSFPHCTLRNKLQGLGEEPHYQDN